MYYIGFRNLFNFLLQIEAKFERKIAKFERKYYRICTRGKDKNSAQDGFQLSNKKRLVIMKENFM